MGAECFDISVLKLCTESFLVSLADKVSRYCGLYTCCGCNAPLYTLCDTCCRQILYGTPVCPVCEKFSEKGEIHDGCLLLSLCYTHCLSCFYYTKTIKYLLRLYKYAAAFQYQREVESLISHYFQVDPFRVIVSWSQLLLNRRIAFIPVPMTERKREERGFSPAYEFAIIFARLFKRIYGGECVLFPTLLQKNNDDGIQSHKKRQSRLFSLQRTYSVVDSSVPAFSQYSPEVVVIVDDILTTGATTNVVIEQIAKNTQLKAIVKGKPVIRLTFACA